MSYLLFVCLLICRVKGFSVRQDSVVGENVDRAFDEICGDPECNLVCGEDQVGNYPRSQAVALGLNCQHLLGLGHGHGHGHPHGHSHGHSHGHRHRHRHSAHHYVQECRPTGDQCVMPPCCVAWICEDKDKSRFTLNTNILNKKLKYED